MTAFSLFHIILLVDQKTQAILHIHKGGWTRCVYVMYFTHDFYPWFESLIMTYQNVSRYVIKLVWTQPMFLKFSLRVAAHVVTKRTNNRIVLQRAEKERKIEKVYLLSGSYNIFSFVSWRCDRRWFLSSL